VNTGNVYVTLLVKKDSHTIDTTKPIASKRFKAAKIEVYKKFENEIGLEGNKQAASISSSKLTWPA
jgi:hypothetical protein